MPLGQTGIKVKVLGFGAIPILKIGEDEAIEVVRRCYELGINYNDTARSYTVSEERIGKALEDVRDDVYIATKSQARTGEGLLKDLDVSPRNLRTDYIDVYQLHNVSTLEAWRRIKGPREALEAMLGAREEGRVRHFGVTSHNSATLVEIIKEGMFNPAMIPYNFLTLKPEEELLPLCREMRVGTVIMKPFGGGAFFNANTALKFVLSRENIDVVIPGMMSVAEVEENVAVASGLYSLTPGELELIERDREELRHQFCRA